MTIVNMDEETVPAMKVLRVVMDKHIKAGDGAYGEKTRRFCHQYLTLLCEFLNEDAILSEKQAFQICDQVLSRMHVREAAISFFETTQLAQYIHTCKA